MAYSQADLDNIRTCIASGVLETRFADGRTVRYQTIEGMIAAEQRISAAVAATAPNSRPTRRYPGYRSGF